mmetsp:Transcript_12925/g.38442  ORF Transcript_12925/g.38442 Transcript_12925/m.38442 type:complete len:244 (-) Transcript_12925:652-1383(-)
MFAAIVACCAVWNVTCFRGAGAGASTDFRRRRRRFFFLKASGSVAARSLSLLVNSPSQRTRNCRSAVWSCWYDLAPWKTLAAASTAGASTQGGSHLKQGKGTLALAILTRSFSTPLRSHGSSSNKVLAELRSGRSPLPGAYNFRHALAAASAAAVRSSSREAAATSNVWRIHLLSESRPRNSAFFCASRADSDLVRSCHQTQFVAGCDAQGPNAAASLLSGFRTPSGAAHSPRKWRSVVHFSR